MNALRLRRQPLKEMAGAASGVSEFLDAFDPRRMLTMCSVRAVCMTDPSLYSACVMNVTLGFDTYLDVSRINTSFSLC